MQNRKKALFATFVLASIPCYLSHFIWAHSLVLLIFIAALYCLEMIKKDKRWIYPSMFAIAGILLTQPSQAVKIGVMLLVYYIVKAFTQKKIVTNELKAIFYGLIISMIWWFNKIQLMILEQSGYFKEAGRVVTEEATKGFFSKFGEILTKAFSPTGGSATRAYNFGDFFIAKKANMINNPIGIGIFISLLLIIALIFIFIRYKELIKTKNSWITITLFWLIFTFLGVNSETFNLPVGLYAFRFWMLLALPISLLAAQGLWFIFMFFENKKTINLIILFISIIGIIITSAYPKIIVNTVPWQPGGFWTSNEEINGYLWIKDNIPNDKSIFDYGMQDRVIISLEKNSCAWCKDVVDFRSDQLNRSVGELYTFLKNNKYDYITIGGMSFKYNSKYFGDNYTNERIPVILDEITKSEKFRIIHQTKGMVLFKIL